MKTRASLILRCYHFDKGLHLISLITEPCPSDTRLVGNKSLLVLELNILVRGTNVLKPGPKSYTSVSLKVQLTVLQIMFFCDEELSKFLQIL